MLAVATLGFVALHRLLSEVRPADVKAASDALTAKQISGALAFTAISYLALTLYDVMALRTIGRRLPWRTAALASFVSYTLSHNLGAALLTGGTARFRIYSRAGLKTADVARIIATASLTFWSGVIAVAGLSLAVHPGTLAIASWSVPHDTQRLAGGVILFGIAIGLLAAGKESRTISLRGWVLPIPSAGQALLQIAVSGLDLVAAGAALFVPLPGLGATDFPTFFPAYALAIIVALVTTFPAGSGCSKR